MKKKWTLSDINFLIKHYSEVGGPSICSEELNRSYYEPIDFFGGEQTLIKVNYLNPKGIEAS